MSIVYDRIDIHNHTRYSNLRLRDALATPEQLIDRAIEIGLKGIAITDHEALSAHPKANQYAQKIQEKNPDFKVILGNEIYLVDERPSKQHWHYILLAKDAIGHYQLRRLSTLAWLNCYVSSLTRVDTLKSEIETIVGKNPGHLIASTACLGGECGTCIVEIAKAKKNNNQENLLEYSQKLFNFLEWNKKIFKEDFYLEVQPGTSKEQIVMNKGVLSLSKKLNLPLIITSDTHYLKKEDRLVHKSFLNSENKEREVDAFYQDTYLHTQEEIFEKLEKSDFSKDDVIKCFQNSMEIYSKIENFSLLHSQQIPEVPVDYFHKGTALQKRVLDYPTLYQMFDSENQVERYWINKCISKLVELNKCNKLYLSELEEEAEVKRVVGNRLHTNMFSYPIALAYYINLIWDCGSSVGVGRGSACSALNHYLLGITQLDPLEWNFPFFRYMNRDTEGLGDIDLDMCPSKVQEVLKKIKEERSSRFDSKLELNEIEKENLGAAYVCTFGTESSKSAVLTSCRGYRSKEFPEGIDVDTAQYLSSLIPQERGFVWSLSEVFYGNPNKNRKPVQPFIQEVQKYEGLREIMLGIEGLISRRGRHASGILFLGTDPYEFNAFMKTPSGEVVTQYDLHDAEVCGSTKMDILVTEIQDKIVQTIHFLQDFQIIEKKLSLKEAYNKYLHPDVLPLKDKKTWETIQNAASLDLFQFDSPIGRQGAKKVKPSNMIELSATNGLIRLMTAEKGEESWLDKFVRYQNKREYEKDIQKYHLTEKEKETINKYISETRGIGISQEQLMKTLMDKDICNYSLKEANRARKIVSKKRMSEIPNFKKKVYETAKSKGIADYVWDYIVSPGLGYSFSDIHSLSYSFIGFQSAYLATHWNPIFWNTSCLIVNSGSLDEESSKEKGTDYKKLAKAIGDIRSKGIKVSLVNINYSSYSFIPDLSRNEILFGLKGVNKVGTEVIQKIIQNRPYQSIVDFMEKCPLNKTVMISLIKAGAFDEIDKHWAEKINKQEVRKTIMAYYIYRVSDLKKRLTLQNFNGLIQKGLIPENSFENKVFKFNKFLKKNCQFKEYYFLTPNGYTFCEKFFKEEDWDNVKVINSISYIPKEKWEKIYKREMLSAKDYIEKNKEQLLKDFNSLIFKENWDKYSKGNISAWEMESLCFYYHKHELNDVNVNKYGLADFEKLPTEPVVDYCFTRAGRNIPIYKIERIVGTVLGKEDTRSSVFLLTTSGVVTVKFSKEYFAMYNRQISEVLPDGTKKVLEKGWFTRGTKILVCGFRREDTFVAKTYKSTKTHQLYKILDINDKGDLILIHERSN